MIFIAGGTGFVGSSLIEELQREGIPLRCLVRTPEKGLRLKERGIEFHAGDITDRESLRGALKGVDTVIHLVGIMEGRPEDFKKVHVEGTKNLLDEALSSGIKTFFYQSALGASIKGDTPYEKTKAMAEELVKASGIPYIIFRPSLLIGKIDGFTKRLMEVIKSLPVIPVPGDGNSRFQPLFIDDWIKAFRIAVIERKERNRLYELGGPEHLTYNEIIKTMSSQMGVNKPVIHIPIWILKAGLPAGRLIKSITGLDIPLPTIDQLKLLKKDNITLPDVIKKEFGFEPRRYRDYISEVLQNSRPISDASNSLGH
jgi:uncharacterized protein YbjT (DUF2867 family)